MAGMTSVVRSQSKHVLRDTVLEFVRAHPGLRFGPIADGIFGTPYTHDWMCLHDALNALRTEGLIRYVSRTSVPFDPVATHNGWWPA
jgi:hypothetical protein